MQKTKREKTEKNTGKEKIGNKRKSDGTEKDSLEADKGSADKEKTKKGGGILFALISLLSALLVIALVIFGSLFFILKMNFLGVADTYRDAVEKIPILNMALPKEDTITPENTTFEELLQKNRELENQNGKLASEGNTYLAEIERLKKFENEYQSLILINDEKTSALEKQISVLEADKKKLEDMKYTVERMVAEGDKEGFAAYFEIVSPEVSKEIYAQVLQEQKMSAEAKSFIKLYETLDTKATAQIFETLGNSKLDMIADVLKGMKRETAAEILAAMSPEFSAALTLRLAA